MRSWKHPVGLLHSSVVVPKSSRRPRCALKSMHYLQLCYITHSRATFLGWFSDEQYPPFLFHRAADVLLMISHNLISPHLSGVTVMEAFDMLAAQQCRFSSRIDAYTAVYITHSRAPFWVGISAAQYTGRPGGLVGIPETFWQPGHGFESRREWFFLSLSYLAS